MHYVTAGEALVCADASDRPDETSAGSVKLAIGRRTAYGDNAGDVLGYVYGTSHIRVDPWKPFPTVTHNSGGNLIHPDGSRCLSVGELKSACSFPAEFVVKGSRSSGIAQVGNAVCPLMLRAVAAVVRKVVRG